MAKVTEAARPLANCRDVVDTKAHDSGGGWWSPSLSAWIAVRVGGWSTSDPQIRQRSTISRGTGLSRLDEADIAVSFQYGPFDLVNGSDLAQPGLLSQVIEG
jgi:hypothetical protein